VVVFRLTEREFAQLQKAVRRSGRNLSDYTRAGILAAIQSDEERNPNGVREQMSEMRTTLQEMKELIQCALSTRGQAAS
jgi:hypothetical protein